MAPGSPLGGRVGSKVPSEACPNPLGSRVDSKEPSATRLGLFGSRVGSKEPSAARLALFGESQGTVGTAHAEGRASALRCLIQRAGSWTPGLNGSRNSAASYDSDLSEGYAEPATFFPDAAEMKARVRQHLMKPKVSTADFYWETGLWQMIAKSAIFENVTLGVAILNAIWLAIDTNFNKEDTLGAAEWYYQVGEHFFCTYFSLELLTRFMAFRRVVYAVKDARFMFDSVLLALMIIETWVMSIVLVLTGSTGASGGGIGNEWLLRLLKIMRLTRVARMARLLRIFPELMILIKGMVSATRSVFFTLFLLFVLLYVGGIGFTQTLAGTVVGVEYFYNVQKSMETLLIDGALLDNPGRILRTINAESPLGGVAFLIFVLLAALTIMNMLVGVLCEVVSAVAAMEREEILVNSVMAKMNRILADIDENGDGTISKFEFKTLLEHPEATRTLHNVGVDVEGLVDFADFIFQGVEEETTDRELSFTDFMELVLQFRGTNTATVKDMVDLRKFVQKALTQTNSRILQIMEDLDMGGSPKKMSRESSLKVSKITSRRSRDGSVSAPPVDISTKADKESTSTPETSRSFLKLEKQSCLSVEDSRLPVLQEDTVAREDMPEKLVRSWQELRDLTSALSTTVESRMDELQQHWRPSPTACPDPGGGRGDTPNEADEQITAAAAAVVDAVEGRAPEPPGRELAARAAVGELHGVSGSSDSVGGSWEPCHGSSPRSGRQCVSRTMEAGVAGESKNLAEFGHRAGGDPTAARP